jgi:UDP-GlcNAc:undecaprenyl-phosphate GlcNAc-1-phosphate transferase
MIATFFLPPLLISGTLTAALIRWSSHLGLVDHPSARKVHTQPTPRGGGLAIYAAFALTACLFARSFSGHFWIVLGAGLVIVLLGLADDWRPLSWQLRLGVQTAVAVGVVSAWPAETSWPFRGLAVLWIVGLTNAFNMLDNMDALSAGVAWIAAFLLAFASVPQLEPAEDWSPALPYLMLMGALSGFLYFNQPPARIFMGDAGSTFLGFFLGLHSLEGGFVQADQPQTWAVPLCILAVPSYDLCTVVALRLWQGRSPFHADKQHLSHRLVALGLPSPTAVRVIYLLALGSGICGLLLPKVSPEGAVLIGVQLACWWCAVAVVEYFRHYRSASGSPAPQGSQKDQDIEPEIMEDKNRVR